MTAAVPLIEFAGVAGIN